MHIDGFRLTGWCRESKAAESVGDARIMHVVKIEIIGGLTETQRKFLYNAPTNNSNETQLGSMPIHLDVKSDTPLNNVAAQLHLTACISGTTVEDTKDKQEAEDAQVEDSAEDVEDAGDNQDVEQSKVLSVSQG